jgi:hypothetical protein
VARSCGITTLRGRCTFYVVDNYFDLRYLQDIVPNWSPDKAERFRKTFAANTRFSHQSDNSAGLSSTAKIVPWWKISTDEYRSSARAHPVAQRSISVPTWMLVAVLAIAPLVSARVLVRRFARSKPGCCPQCGYDVRATPDRCPECAFVPAGDPKTAV